MLHLGNQRSIRDSEARLDEPVNEEKERRNTGSFVAQFEKREEFSVDSNSESSGVSWSLEDFFRDGDDEYAGERGWSVLHDYCAVGCVIICEVTNQLAEGLQRCLTMMLTD